MLYKDRIVLYEQLKAKIVKQNLKPTEYEKCIRLLAKKLNI